MKAIVAYIRPHMVQATVAELLEAGCEDILVHEVKRVVPGLRGNEYSYSVDIGQRYEAMTALICPAEDNIAPRWVDVLRASARTGHHGDGEIMVLPVEAITRISGSRQ